MDALWSYVITPTLSIFSSLVKVLLHAVTGHCELSRVCRTGLHNTKMSFSFATSLRKSKQLKTIRTIIFYPQPFSVKMALDNIVAAKKIEARKSPLVLANMRLCLSSLRFVNLVISRIEKLQKASFSHKEEAHGALLTTYWLYMFGDQQRCPETTAHEDWKLLGWQGNDPSTDLRGMGMLALHQLVYFAQHDTSKARQILMQSTDEQRYFPFSATGVNVTAFCCELLRETRCHALLFAALEANTSFKGEGSGINNSDANGEGDGEKALLGEGVARFHRLFCNVFIDFAQLWETRKPKSIMEFGTIFNELKQTYRAKAAFSVV